MDIFLLKYAAAGFGRLLVHFQNCFLFRWALKDLLSTSSHRWFIPDTRKHPMNALTVTLIANT